LYRSNDFGATFTQKIIDSNVPGNSDEIYNLGISGDGQRIIVPTSHYGKVYLSLNYGASFSAMSGLPNVGWSAAGISGDGNTLVAAAFLDNIWVSHDAGSTWKENVVDLYPPYKNWGQVALSYDGQIIGLTRYGYKLITSDTGGDSWEVKPKIGPKEHPEKYPGGEGAFVECKHKQAGQCPPTQSHGYQGLRIP